MDHVRDQARNRFIPSSLTISLALVLISLWAGKNYGTTLGHDQVSYLVEAERFLGGDEIYGPHLSETNPPLIIWFSTLPVMLTHHLSGSVEFWFRSLVLLIICCSTAWCVRLVQRSSKLKGGLPLALCAFLILTVELRIAAFDFGQREHLLVIFLLPYLIGVATGAVARLSAVERYLMGFAAGCAIWFKPQDILVVIGLEIACALCARTLLRLLSVEFIAMVLAASFLLLLTLLLTPLYMHQVVALLSDVYWALGTNTFSSLLLGSHTYLVAVLLTLLCYLLLRKRLLDRTTPVAFLTCSVGGYVAYALQHTTWPYHRYPHQAFCLLAFSYMVLDFLGSSLTRVERIPLLTGRPALATTGCALTLALILAFYPQVLTTRPQPPASKPLDLFLEQVKPGSTVSALSTSVGVLASVYDHGLKWGSRFAHLWMLPAIIQNEMGRTSSSSPFQQLSPQTTSRLAALQRQEVAEDLKYWSPDFVLVPICNRNSNCQGMQGKDVDLVAWFERSAEFSQAWSRYERQPDIEGFTIYRLAR